MLAEAASSAARRTGAPTCMQRKSSRNAARGSIAKPWKRFCLVSCISSIAILPIHTQAQNCLTPSPTSCEKTIMWLVDRQWEQSNDGGRRRLTEDPALPTYTIPVVFHALAKEDSGAGNLNKKDRARFMEALEVAFSPTPFSFEYQGTTLSRNNTWHSCEDEETFKPLLRVGARNTLNVYVCDSRKYRVPITRTFSVAAPMIGIATFPHQIEQREDGMIHDGVVIRNPAKEFLQKLKKVQLNQKLPRNEVFQTLVHEVGHWLGLLHTFEGGCSRTFAHNEFVNGAVGDGVEDTAAEAGPAWNNEGWERCFRNDKVPNTCSDSTRGIDPGRDPVQNYMDYNDAKCMKKLGEFTEKQTTRMVAQYQTFRLGQDLQKGNDEGGRRLASSDFIPDKELIAICVSSAVQECACGLDCYYKFRDLLRDFLPFGDFDKMKSDIFYSCSQCSTIGSDTECPTRDEYCDYGTDEVLGHRCKKKIRSRHLVDSDGNLNTCWTGRQCRSGHCVAGRCRRCPVPGSSSGCEKPDKFFCGIEQDFDRGAFRCIKKLKLGKRCYSNDSCKSGHCTGGSCSSCGPRIDSSDSCPAGQRCRLHRQGWRKYYKCKSDRRALLGNERRLEQRSCSAPGTSEGCDQRSQYCSAGSVCVEKIRSPPWLILNLDWELKEHRCWFDGQCYGYCVDGRCQDCRVLGSSDDCLDPATQVCGSVDGERSLVCLRKLGDLETCFTDDQCRSGDCRNGKCYGSCSRNADCGKDENGENAVCDGGFCVLGNDVATTRQSYFNHYDCRMGIAFERCQECADERHWQCLGEQFCDPAGLCQAKRSRGDTCSGDEICVSAKCKDGACGSKPECERNFDCTTSVDTQNRYCEGYKCRDQKDLGDWCTEHYQCLSLACDVFAQRCIACRDDNQCPTSAHCLFGRCRERQCVSHQDCAADQVCKFQGDFNAWSCVECVTDEHCSSIGGGCDLATNKCVGCLHDGHCLVSEYCLVGIQRCEPKQCSKNSDCTNQATSRCDVGATWTCIECQEDKHCEGNVDGNSYCENKMCVACIGENTGCRDDEYCSRGNFVTSCEPIPTFGCETDMDCVDDSNWAPFCESPHCIQCRSDDDCVDLGAAARDRNGYPCRDGFCMQCSEDEHCAFDEQCDLGVCFKKGCLSDEDCVGNEFGNVCEVGGRHVCIQCQSAVDCPENLICNVPTSACGECLSDFDCPFNEYCVTRQMVCHPKECSSHSDCKDGGKLCSFKSKKLAPFDQYRCVECLENDQCVEGNKRVCDFDDNVCVECSSRQDCEDIGKICDTDIHECIAQRCLSDEDCASNGDGSKNFCFFLPWGNECLPCFNNDHCQDGFFCDQSNGYKLNECIPKECSEDTDCLDLSKPFCNPGDALSEKFECVACRKNEDCFSARPNCYQSANYTCVGCFSELDCPGDSTCDFSIGECVVDVTIGGEEGEDECTSNEDCQGSPDFSAVNKLYCSIASGDDGFGDFGSFGGFRKLRTRRLSSHNECVVCLEDSHCADSQFCDFFSHTCQDANGGFRHSF